MVDDAGEPFRWVPDDDGVIRISVVGNPTTSSGFRSAAFERSLERSLVRWQHASMGRVDFDLWTGTGDDRLYPQALRQDGVNSVFYASQLDSDPGEYLDANTAAYTLLWVDEETREILEFDLVLNDLSYLFSEAPDDADYGAGFLNRVLIMDDVLTHELGHALGLGHSGVQPSSLYTWSWPGQDSLSCDDQVGLRAAYVSDPNLGAISGRVLGPHDEEVLGAQVTLISRERRSVYASALAGEQGQIRLTGLEPGEYYVLIEPFYGRAENLVGLYLDLDHALCAEGLFPRTFLLEDDGVTPRPVTVTAGGEVQISPLRIRCTADGGANATASDAPTERIFAETLLGPLDRDLLLLDRMDPDSERRWYHLEDLSGTLTLTALSYSLWSPIWLEMELFDDEGQELLAVISDTPLYSGEDGHIVYDAQLSAEDLPRGDYWLAVRPAGLPVAEYPRGDLYLDPAPFFLLFGGLDEDVELDALLDYSLGACTQVVDETLEPNEQPAPRAAWRACGVAPGPAGGLLALAGVMVAMRRRRWERG